MNKSIKYILTAIIAALLFTSNAYSIGAGLQLGVVPAVDCNAAEEKMNNFDGTITGTIRFFRIPAVIGFGLEAGKDYDYFTYGVSGFVDYWFLDYQIKNTWNVYSGAGFAGKVMFNKETKPLLSAGPRFFAGMNWLFLDNYIEYYAQLTVEPSYNKIKDSVSPFFRINVPVETGVRVHF